MRMYFVVKERMLPQQSEENVRAINALKDQFNTNKSNFADNSSR